MREMTTMDLEKDLIEIEHAIKSQIERDNMFTASVLQRCEKLVCELRKYKDLEEQGKLLRLPVAAGETVYTFSLGKVIALRVSQIVADELSVNICMVSAMAEYPFLKIRADCSDFCDKYFKTYESAEAKLRERR